MSAKIFISHASKDRKVALTLCNALEARGLRCWMSHRDISPGANFQEEIFRALRSMKLMVLVFTSNANNSNEIKKELALASQFGVLVIPTRVEDVVPNEAFAYELATRQWVDMFDDWETAVTKLVDRIAVIESAKPMANVSAKGETRQQPKAAPAPINEDDGEKRATVLLKEGEAAEQRKQYQSAARFYRQAADRGSSEAMQRLSRMWDQTDDLKARHDATAWYRGAADRGSVDAMYGLGRLLETTGRPSDRSEAVDWYKCAAEQGHSDAQYLFCLCQYAGEGTPKDLSQARAKMKQLAANGHVKAREWLSSH